MSHFTVLVIGDNPNEQLAPYDEGIEMPEYKDGLVKLDEIKSFTDTYASYDKERSYGAKGEEEALKNIKLSFDELYEIYGEDWNSKCWKKDENNEWVNYSTYNPKSKWDWKVLGGRWAGKLKLKDNSEGTLQTPKINGIYHEIDKNKRDNYKKNLEERKVDSAKVKDIDFSMDQEKYNEAARFWELYIEGQEPKDEKDKELIDFPYYKKEYYTKRYNSKKDYAESEASFSTFAVVRNGEWFEKGKMGCWACHSATPEQEVEWDNDFYNKWLKEMPGDTLISVFDCHI